MKPSEMTTVELLEVLAGNNERAAIYGQAMGMQPEADGVGALAAELRSRAERLREAIAQHETAKRYLHEEGRVAMANVATNILYALTKLNAPSVSPSTAGRGDE